MSTPISRADRRRARRPAVERVMADGADVEAALDVLELTEFAWHDCYDAVTPPDDVIDDIYTCSQGRLAEFVRAARLAVEDARDLRVHADGLR